MATTGLQTGTLPDEIINWSLLRTAEKSAFIRSPAMMRDPRIDTGLALGGETFRLNFWNSNSTAENISDATTNEATPIAITGGKQRVVGLRRNQGWSGASYTAMVEGNDPFEAIVENESDYWARRYDAAVVAMLTGIEADNDANDSDDMIVNHKTASGSAANLTSAVLNEATHSVGENYDTFQNGVLIVHSAVHEDIVNVQLTNGSNVAFENAIDVGFGTFQGKTLVVSDRCPVVSSDYLSFLLAPGALRWGQAPHPRGLVIDEREREGKGAGTRELWSRRNFAFALPGIEWASTDANPANTGTANDDLDEAAGWSRVFPEREQVPCVFIWTTST